MLLTGLAWSTGPAVPVALGNTAALSTGAGVILFGGATSPGGNTTPSGVHLFDPFGGTWTTVAGSDQGRNGGGVGATGSPGPIISGGGESGYKYTSDIFQFGGANQGHLTASVYNYDTGGRESTNGPALSAARYRLAYATDPATGDLYAIGGLGSSGTALSSVERYDPQADAWSAVASLPQARYAASAASDGAGHILVFGGDNSAGAVVNTVYSYTTASNTWTSATVMPQAASGTAAVFGAYGQIYVIGGLTAGGAVPDVRVYNPVTNQWAAEAPLPAAVYGAAATIDDNNSLDVFGGFSSANTAVATLYQSAALPAPTGLPAVPNITLDGLYPVYDGMPQGATATADIGDGFTPVDGFFSFTYNGSPMEPVDVGTYQVLAAFTSNDSNYVNTVTQGTLYMGQATPTLAISGGGTITYDGMPHGITATALGANGVTPVSGSFSYSYNGSPSAPVNPGTYSAIATFTSGDTNYATTSATTTITIPDPTIPTGVTAAGASTNSIRVSWSPVSGAAYYNVYERHVLHDPKGSGSTITYPLVAGNVIGTSAIITVAQVKGYTFYVTSVSATNVQSARSAPASAEPLYAPSLASMLWNGAVTSYATVQAGQTLHVTLLGYGNEPPTYTMTSGPATMTVDPTTGVVTYTPGPAEGGYVSATFQASNSLGTSAATFQFHVLAPPAIDLNGAGGPNYTASWFNSGPVPLENMAQATVADAAGLTDISSLTVTLATFHTGDVLSVPILAGNTAISASYSAGTLSLTGTASLAQYTQELRLINYDNTNGGPGATPITATFVASDGDLSGTPVTATIYVSVASGEVLGNRLFYNNSKYDGNNGAINSSDDAAVAPDKVGFNGTGTATFANVSSATRGITGVMVDLASGLGTHANITSGDITFKVAPAFSGTYNQLSTWTTFTSQTAISVRMGSGTGGSDRLEVTFANNAIKNTWLEVNVAANANTGLSTPDIFYFGSAAGDSGLGDTSALAKVDINDANPPMANILGLTTQVFQILDYTKDGKVDINDANAATSLFTLRYIANPTGPFAPDGGGGAAPAAVAIGSAAPAASTTSVSSAVSSGLSLLNRPPTNPPTWLAGRLQGILSSQPVANILQKAAHNSQILQTIDQITAKLHLNEDVLDGLLADLGLE